MIGGWEGGSVSSVLKYEVSSNSWSELVSMQTARWSPGVCAVGAHLYCIGGMDEDEDGGYVCLASVERYDTESGRWTSLTPMPTPRSNPAVFVLQGNIYVAGGMNGEMWLNVVERYDPGTDSWDTVASLDDAVCERPSGCSMKTEVNYFSWLLSGGRDHS